MALSYVFNPFTGQFDAVDAGGSFWGSPVADLTTLNSITTDSDGTVRIILSTNDAYRWNSTGNQWVYIGKVKTSSIGTSPNSSGFSIGSDNTITLQPADSTHGGIVSTGIQTLAGNKTLSGNLTVSGSSFTDGGIDLSSSGTLSIGTGINTTSINIGNVGSTVNIQGTVITETTSTLNVTNPVITVNSNGAVGSAANSGIQVEENGVITGYSETSANRNSWILKAPNTAGIATITPGVSGITINQSLSSADSPTFADVTLSNLNSSGVVHNNSSGVLSTSLIVNADISTSAAVARSKVATGTVKNVVFNDNSTGALSENSNLQFDTSTTTLSSPTFATSTESINGSVYTSSVADGNTAVAHKFATTTTYANGSAKIFSVYNNGFEKFYIDPSGGALFNSNVTVAGTLTATSFVKGIIQSNGTEVKVVTKTADYTITIFDDTILADATSGAINLTLPAASNKNIFRIIKTDSTANTVTLTRSGSDTINGVTTKLLSNQYDSITLEGSGGTSYNIIAFGSFQLTGDVTAGPGVGSQTATIAANVVSNSKLAQMAAHTFKGNNTGSTANASDLTATQLTAELNNFVGDSGSGGTKGLVPAPASGDAAASKFLKADGTWTIINTGSSPGDINETSFSPANNQSSVADVTGLAFANGTVRSAEVLYSVFINATSSLYESGKLLLIQKGASWSLSRNSTGDDSLITFTITNAGQVQYVSSNYSGFSAATLKFRAITTSV